MSIVSRAGVPAGELQSFGFTSTHLNRFYFPGWGISGSLLFHTIACLLLLSIGDESSPVPLQPSKNKRTELGNVIYLPTTGRSVQMRKTRVESSDGEPPAASGPRGLVHPGPLPIRSDSSRPTNRIQTVLQPELEDLPILRPPIPLPNLVLIGNTRLISEPELTKPPDTPPSESPKAVAERPPETLADSQPADPPPLPLPQALTSLPLKERFVVLPLPVADPPPSVTRPAVPTTESAEHPIQAAPLPLEPMPENEEILSASSGVELIPLADRLAALHNLISLTPLPARQIPVEIPFGEAWGRFVVSPQPNLSTDETEPGSIAETATSTTGPGGPGEATGQGSGAIGAPPSIVTITIGSGESGGGPGSAADTGGFGAGFGAGPVPGEGPFSGVTIIGGISGDEPESGSAPDAVVQLQTALPVQTSYGLFVVSTEKSGGGLPSFGVFENLQVHTVYLDMRELESDTAPSWTLELGTPPGLDVRANTADHGEEPHEGLVLPFPTVKERPSLPAELVRNNLGRMVIVSGVINVEGQLEQLVVRASPNPLLNEPVIEALSRWLFRPALLEGEPVETKILLGIPLWSPG